MVDENDDMSIDPATEIKKKKKKKIDSLQTETHDDRSISSVPPAYMMPYYMRFLLLNYMLDPCPAIWKL